MTNENEISAALLASEFETHRDRLRAVAYRMLGSRTEADDAVQEAWLRLARTERGSVENLGGWLTTVVARVALDQLRARRSRREDPAPAYEPTDGVDLEGEAVLADSLGPALLVVLATLQPGERLAFVLHDLFGVPFDEIARIAGRSEAASRQLASRARRRIQGAPVDDVDRSGERVVVEAFLRASRNGDFDGLLQLLDPDVVVRPDAAAAKLGSKRQDGASEVAKGFITRAGATAALVDGAPGAAWAPGGVTKVVLDFTITNGRIVAIDLVGDPAQIAEIELEWLEPIRT